MNHSRKWSRSRTGTTNGRRRGDGWRESGGGIDDDCENEVEPVHEPEPEPENKNENEIAWASE